MPSYKVLGQSLPNAETLTDLYTVPASTEVVISTVAICNTTTGLTSYRIAIRPGGATAALRHYLVYNTPINGSDSVFLTLGVTMGPTDVLSVYAGASGVSFSAYGSEIAQ